MHHFLALGFPSFTMPDTSGAHERAGSGVLFGDRSRPGILRGTRAARKVHAVDLITGMIRQVVGPGGTKYLV